MKTKIENWIKSNMKNGDSITGEEIYNGIGLNSGLVEFRSELGKLISAGELPLRRAGRNGFTYGDKPGHLEGKDLEKLIAWVKTKMGDDYMTSTEIFNELNPENITLERFKLELSRLSSAVGLEGKPKAGYRKVDDIIRIEDDEAETEEPEAQTIINIGNGYRLINLDQRNWALQKKTKDIWTNQCYYSKITDAINGIAKYMIDKKVKKISKEVDIRDVKIALEEACREIREFLQEKIAEVA